MSAWLAEVQFHVPLWLSLWPVSILILLGLTWRGQLNNKRMGAMLPGASRDVFLHPQATVLQQLATTEHLHTRRRGWLWSLMGSLLIISAAHVALAQPYRFGEKIPQPPLQRDVVFIVDTSITMVLRDYFVDGKQVNRLRMLQSVLQHFTRRLEGNRMSIVVFSEQAHTLVPLTTDTQLLDTMLRRLEITLTGRISDVSKGILYALKQVQTTAADRPSGYQQGPRPRPVLILVSDINRPVREVDPRAAAAYVAQAGFQLHAVGIGAASEEAIEQDSTSLIYDPLNVQLLEEIARNGNGRFFHARNTTDLREAIATIQSAARIENKPEPRYVPVNLYHWPLGFAILVLVLMHIVTLWRQR